MTITDAEVEAAARAIYAEMPNFSTPWRPNTSGGYDQVRVDDPWEDAPDRHADCIRHARAALLAASQARALSSGEGEAQVMLDLIREEVSKSNSPLGRSDSLAIDRVRSLLSVRPHPPSKDNTNE